MVKLGQHEQEGQVQKEAVGEQVQMVLVALSKEEQEVWVHSPSVAEVSTEAEEQMVLEMYRFV